MHQQGHNDGEEQAQADEDVLCVLHHRQVGVEGVQDGPVDVATLRRFKYNEKASD